MLAIVAFLVFGHWVVFGPGDRSGRLSGSFLPGSIAVGDTPSRIIAAAFTLVFDAILILGIVQWIRRARMRAG